MDLGVQALRCVSPGCGGNSAIVAKSHGDYFAAIAELPAERQRLLEEEARMSLQRQKEIEASDSITFDEYLDGYFASD